MAGFRLVAVVWSDVPPVAALLCAVARFLCELAAYHFGVPIVALVDDFFAVVPALISQKVFDMFKRFLIDLLGFCIFDSCCSLCSKGLDILEFHLKGRKNLH